MEANEEAAEGTVVKCRKRTDERDTNNEVASATIGLQSNISHEELDETTRKKLRGDAIGNTMYSESFVIKALLGLRDVRWDKDYEEALMTLWDMSIDKDVSRYLHETDYPSLISTVIAEHPDNDRLIEILIGIVSNMVSTCESVKLEKAFLEELGALFVKCNDPQTLIQLFRVFSGHCHATDGDLSFLQEPQMEKVNFILENSKNRELLKVAINAVKIFTWDCYLPYTYITDAFVGAFFTGYSTVLRPRYDYEDHREAVKDAMEVICNICGYYDDHKKSSNPDAIKLADAVRSHTNKFVYHMEKLMKYYGHKDRVVPTPTHFDFYLDTIDFVCNTLYLDYNRTIFINLCKIIHYFSKKDWLNETCLQLAKHFINQNSSAKLIDDLHCLGSRDVILNVLKLVKEKYVAIYDQKLDHCIDYFRSPKTSSPSTSASDDYSDSDNYDDVSDPGDDNDAQPQSDTS